MTHEEINLWRVTDAGGVLGYGPYYRSPLTAELQCKEGEKVVQMEVSNGR